MVGPLANIRVLDLSRVLAGPWASQILADLGAEVIKVERPGRGDDTRAWGPPFLADAEGRETGESAYFLSANRGKKSVTIDITRAEGQALVRRLAGRSDVLLENFRVGALARFGLDYESLRAVNPRLVYCSITGFGQTGPARDRAGYDAMIQALGGLMSITGEPDAEPGGGPQKVGVALADVLTGLYAAVAVLAALAHRERSGAGQWIDLALLDVQIACLANQAMNYLISGVPPVRMGTAHPNIVPYQVFATSDGHLVLAVGNDEQFASFCRLAGRPELAREERFATNAARVRNREALVPIIAALVRERATQLWLDALEAAGIPCGPIHTIDRVFAQPQAVHRGMRFDMSHPTAGRVPQVASPMRFSASPVAYEIPPPLLGQHNDEVLGELLEIDVEARRALRDRGIV
ncbi:MAG: CoA transferase [Myxococcales bacterium]|nr:CoA transferase [Myxococcales bacterium]MDH5305710.1 CoA transferase [Myxococcales bacterium]